jgi:hypothetical protein
VRATLHPDPDSKSSVPDLLPATFASNKEDEEKDSPKKRPSNMEVQKFPTIRS